MLSLLFVLAFPACDDSAAPVTSPEKSGATSAELAEKAPPTAMTGLRYGASFVRGCWFSSYTDDQRKKITEIATLGSGTEVAARTGVAGGVLDVTQAVADKKGDADVEALGAGLAKAERTYLEAQIADLAALLAVMEKEQLDAGGTQCGTKALAAALTTNGWLMENNPFDRTPPQITEEAELAKVVSRKLSVARSFLTFQGVSAVAGTKIATLDLTASDWQPTFAAAEKEILDAWEAHRANTITNYGQWAVSLPDATRTRLVLDSAIQAALSLPPADESLEAGIGGGQGGLGSQMGGGLGGQGAAGGQSSGMGGMGGQGGGMGGQGGGMGGQGGGMGGQGGGMGGQGGGMGGQGGGMGGTGGSGGMGGQGGGMGGQGGGTGGSGGMGGGGSMGGGGMGGGGQMGGGQMGGGQMGGQGGAGQTGGTQPAPTQGGPK